MNFPEMHGLDIRWTQRFEMVQSTRNPSLLNQILYDPTA